ncbi:MAG TPA: hypothetical protein VJC10_02215 [Patescibacteria group bacterium]|nr:hypothetical protein [Patescibacteria group bacterium]
MANSTIVIIADYGNGDPAFTEVSLQIKQLLPEATIIPQSTPAFSTINTGFWIYQIAATPHLQNTYIYSNTAPRKEDKQAQMNNRGEKLMYAKLKNGFEIVAVNAGFVFSFVKPLIEEFYFINIPDQGSQFRSRDIFPKAVAQMIQKDADFLEDKGNIDTIPDHPRNVITSIDGYGNIKTSARFSEVAFEPGQPLIIDIHHQKHLATYTDGIFHVKDGELTFAPGSSGHNDKFMELVLRGGSAYRLFDRPEVEESFEITLP